MRLLLLVFLLMWILLVFGCGGTPAPDFKVFGDKKELMVFCTNPCPPCVALKKNIKELSLEGKLQDWLILTIEDDEVSEANGIEFFPTVWATDSKGKRLGSFSGYKTKKEFMDWIESLAN